MGGGQGHAKGGRGSAGDGQHVVVAHHGVAGGAAEGPRGEDSDRGRVREGGGGGEVGLLQAGQGGQPAQRRHRGVRARAGRDDVRVLGQ